MRQRSTSCSTTIRNPERMQCPHISEIAREFHPAQVRLACPRYQIKSPRSSSGGWLSPSPGPPSPGTCSFLYRFLASSVFVRIWKFRFFKFVRQKFLATKSLSPGGLYAGCWPRLARCEMPSSHNFGIELWLGPVVGARQIMGILSHK